MNIKYALPALYCLLILGPPRINFGYRGDSRERDLQGAIEGASLENVTGFSFNNVLSLGVWGIAGIVAFVIASNNWNKVVRFYKEAPLFFLLAYGVVAVLSAAYSPSPAYTLFFASKFLIFSIISIYLCVSRTWYFPLQLIGIAFFIRFVFVFVLYIYNPALVGAYSSFLGYRLTGGIISDYGASARITGLFCLAFLLTYKFYSKAIPKIIILLLCFCLFFLLLSQTRTAFFAFGFGCLSVLYFCYFRRTGPIIALLVFLVIFSIIFGIDSHIKETVLRGQTTEQFRAMSNRDLALNYVLDRWQDKPILGHGFAAGSREIMIDFMRDSGHAMGSAHDSISRVLADLGIVGAILLSGLGITSLIWIVRIFPFLVEMSSIDIMYFSIAVGLMVPVVLFFFVSQSFASFSALHVASIVSIAILYMKMNLK